MAFKRMIVLSDGTWQTLENATPTNIQHLTCAIAPEDDEGVQQVLSYDPGVGTEPDGNPLEHLIGGAFGAGVDRNIQQLYLFLALNYEDGDEIYLFGFSRGAYTVRSLNGMLSVAGLVRRRNVSKVGQAYELYRKAIAADDKEAVEFRTEFGTQVPVTLLACFDTVGSLGIPFMPPFFNRNRYQFHDTTLSATTENAIHMLSIDEDRKSFQPTPMTEHPDKPGQLSELYFWGGHGGIGGGDDRQSEASKATMSYLLSEMERRGLGLKVRTEELPGGYDGECPVPNLGGGLDAVIRTLTGTFVRTIDDIGRLHESAVERYVAKEAEWQPKALEGIREKLLARGRELRVERGLATAEAEPEAEAEAEPEEEAEPEAEEEPEEDEEPEEEPPAEEEGAEEEEAAEEPPPEE